MIDEMSFDAIDSALRGRDKRRTGITPESDEDAVEMTKNWRSYYVGL